MFKVSSIGNTEIWKTRSDWCLDIHKEYVVNSNVYIHVACNLHCCHWRFLSMTDRIIDVFVSGQITRFCKMSGSACIIIATKGIPLFDCQIACFYRYSIKLLDFGNLFTLCVFKFFAYWMFVVIILYDSCVVHVHCLIAICCLQFSGERESRLRQKAGQGQFDDNAVIRVYDPKTGRAREYSPIDDLNSTLYSRNNSQGKKKVTDWLRAVTKSWF